MSICREHAENREKVKKRTSKEIFAEAIFELSKKYPIDKITVKQIVEESGLSLQTFYNHFKDKYDLIFWIHHFEGERMMSKFGDNSYGYDELVKDNIRFYLEHKEFMQSAFTSTFGISTYTEMSSENAYRILSDYIVLHYGKDAFTEEIAFYLKMFALSSVKMTTDWMQHSDGLAPEQLTYYLKEGMPEKLKPFLLGKT